MAGLREREDTRGPPGVSGAGRLPVGRRQPGHARHTPAQTPLSTLRHGRRQADAQVAVSGWVELLPGHRPSGLGRYVSAEAVPSDRLGHALGLAMAHAVLACLTASMPRPAMPGTSCSMDGTSRASWRTESCHKVGSPDLLGERRQTLSDREPRRLADVRAKTGGRSHQTAVECAAPRRCNHSGKRHRFHTGMMQRSAAAKQPHGMPDAALLRRMSHDMVAACQATEACRSFVASLRATAGRPG